MGSLLNGQVELFVLGNILQVAHNHEIEKVEEQGPKLAHAFPPGLRGPVSGSTRAKIMQRLGKDIQVKCLKCAKVPKVKRR